MQKMEIVMDEMTIDADARDTLMRKLEGLEAMTLMALAGGLDTIADSSRSAYLGACYEVAMECNELAHKAFCIE